ncbi:MAG: type II toxin-antitoxin system RelE/ParE family toxin [Candidatus Omnitrophota bacterium]|nr:type II toxin-antitoxin system RelE/ParE family toxin [Candidatus Omnitrophota bacterium]
MRYLLSFLPEVEEDTVSAYIWYEEKSKGLGEEFLRAFYASAAEIARTPNLYPKIYKNFHRKLLKRFPYVVYFLIESGSVIVYGLFHCARNPYSIQGKIDDRPS